MQDKDYKTTLALAGIVQSVNLVRELAQTGKIDEKNYETCIYSIFQTDAADIPSIYGDIKNLKPGLEKLTQLFERNDSSRLLMRYLLSILYLQKKITRSSKLTGQLTQRINQIKKQVEYFSLLHPTVISNLADAYLTTINIFKFRIIIWGSQRSLSVTENMDKIRALLLAGIRSAVLWQQVGGSRLQLLFSRKKIKAMATQILLDIERN